MRVFATPRSWLLRFVLLTAIFVLVGARANAAVDPLWDHYKVYFQNPPITLTPFIPVLLTDQFGPYTHDVMALERFANPVEKRILQPPAQSYPINDSLLHYSWWRITPQPFAAVVTAKNQFGDQTLNVHDAVFLLNPALKNQVATHQIPVKNHYKCYLCDGQPILKDVVLIDQFDSWPTTVLYPRFFCNPVAKQTFGANGQQYPIVDPLQHYVCYDFQPEDPNRFTATMRDQFIQSPLYLYPSRLLCVPTDKTGVTATARDTWGKLKLLYR